MKRTFLITAFALAVAATVVPVANAKDCTIQNVAGSFGYTFSGFVSPAPGTFVPAAGAGTITFDGHGGVTGKQTRVVAGSALDETFSGTYTVDPDCSGSFTVDVLPVPRTSTVRLVWTDDTNGASAVFTNPGFVLAAEAHRITAKN